MGYRCPVCGDPQADDVHLANHLAFTAIARGGDHEAWLDEQVPDWGAMGERELAAQASSLADSAEYPAVFEDTTDRTRRQDAGTETGHDSPGMPVADIDVEMDDRTRSVLEDARELTRQRRANADADGSANGSGDAGSPAE